MASVDELIPLRVALLALACLVPACSGEKTSAYQGYVEGEYVHVASPVAGRLERLLVQRGQVIAAKAPLFEKASIDEFYLDLSGMDRFFDPYQWTIALRDEIIAATTLPISFALASNKMISKIATQEAKPNGYIQVPNGMEQEFLAPLKVNKIPGVGDHTYQSLREMGIETIRDLSEQPVELLERRFGKYGADLWAKSRGIHDGEVIPYHEAKSISTENTFEENKTDVDFLMAELVRMTERVGYELRQDNKTAGCVAVKIRYGDFETTSRQVTIPYTFYDDELIAKAKELFHKLWRKGTPIRLLGVRLSELTGEAIQTNLFQDTRKKNELYKAIDEVKNKWGKGAVVKAGGQAADSGRGEGKGGAEGGDRKSISRFLRRGEQEGPPKNE